MSGCTLKSYNYGKQKDYENYQLLEYYDMSEKRLFLNVGDQVIITFKEKKVVRGKIVDIRNSHTSEAEISIRSEKGIATIKSSEIEHLQIIETPYHRTVLYTASGVIIDVAIFGLISAIQSINDIWNE